MKKSLMVLLLSLAGAYGGGKVLVPSDSAIMPIIQEDPNPWYIGLGFGFTDYDTKCYEDYTYGPLVRIGYDFNPYVGLEFRAIRTFWDKGKNGGERAQHYGLSFKPMYPVTDTLTLYGLLGYGWNGTINTGGNGNLPEIEGNSFTWGVGIEYDLSNNDKQENMIYDRVFDGYADQERGWGLFIDYQSFWHNHHITNPKLHKSAVLDLDALFIGITYDF